MTETQQIPARAHRGLIRGSVFALRRNPNMLIGSVILAVVVVIALVSPYLTRTDPSALNPFDRLQAPSSVHWFGADHLGRDVFDRTLVGSRISLLVGFSVGLVTSVAGLLIGLISGYYRRLDNVIMRFMDGLMAFPSLLLALALIAVLGASVFNVILVICVVDTPRMVRVVRGSVLSLREPAVRRGRECNRHTCMENPAASHRTEHVRAGHGAGDVHIRPGDNRGG